MILDLTKGGNRSAPYSPSSGLVLLRAVVDFSRNPAGASHTVHAITIPEGSLCVGVGAKVLRAEVQSLSVGDLDSSNGWIDGLDLSALGDSRYSSLSLETLGETSNESIIGYTGGRFYSAAHPIVLTPGAALSVAKVEIVALVVPLFI